MLQLTFNNGLTFPIHDDTVIYSAVNINSRSKMAIHIPESVMLLDDFIALVSDENATMHMTISEIDENHNLVRETPYVYYIALAEVGKRRCDVIDVQTGAVISEYHLVAVLEQLTATEQKLRELEAK